MIQSSKSNHQNRVIPFKCHTGCLQNSSKKKLKILDKKICKINKTTILFSSLKNASLLDNLGHFYQEPLVLACLRKMPLTFKIRKLKIIKVLLKLRKSAADHLALQASQKLCNTKNKSMNKAPRDKKFQRIRKCPVYQSSHQVQII